MGSVEGFPHGKLVADLHGALRRVGLSANVAGDVDRVTVFLSHGDAELLAEIVDFWGDA